MQHQTLAQMLLLLLQEQGWTAKHIRGDAPDPATLEQQCLMEADQISKEGRPDLCHRMLLLANRYGMTSPACAHRFAGACFELGDLKQARDIWGRLVKHSDRSVASQAKEMLSRLTADHDFDPSASPQNSSQHATDFPGTHPDHHLLKTRLKAALEAHGVTSRLQLEDEQAISMEDLLNEIITTREEGHMELSLKLIQAARSAGFSSPWLDDNEARLLACTEREEEAVEIWKRLLKEKDEAITDAAREMLAMYDTEQMRRRANILKQVEHLLNTGNVDSATSLLVEQIPLDPDCRRYQDRLNALLLRQRSEGSPVNADEQKPSSSGLELESYITEGIGSTHPGDRSGTSPSTADSPEENGGRTPHPQPNHNLLRAKLKEAVDRCGINLRFIPEDGPEISMEGLLHEIMTLREEGHSELSRKMIHEARAAGFESPWLSDNEARALVWEGREEDAVAVWRSLLKEEDRSVVNAAKEMLALYVPRIEQDRKRTTILAETDKLLAENLHSEAIHLLTDNLLVDPGFEPYRDRLTAAVSLQNAPGSSTDESNTDITRREAWLTSQEILLDAFAEKINALGIDGQKEMSAA